MRKKQKVTVYRLARELKLSPGTVSKAMGNDPSISEETRRAVREKAESYGFKPRPFSKRMQNICALVQRTGDRESMFSSYTSAVLDGIAQYVNEKGIEMSLFSGTAEKLNSLNLVKTLCRMNADGVVIINSNDRSKYYGSLERQKFPYCSLMSGHGKSNRRLLSVDNRQAAYLAVKHLLDMGHRRIGLLNHLAHYPPGSERLTGYRQALNELKVPFHTSMAVEPLPQEMDGFSFGYSATLRLFAAAPELTAVVALDLGHAISALHALHQLRKRVPEDVSILSFDDSPLAPYINPPLTVMRIPNYDFGYAAARWVHQQMEGCGDDVQQPEAWMQGELIVRGSTGPVRGGAVVRD